VPHTRGSEEVVGSWATDGPGAKAPAQEPALLPHRGLAQHLIYWRLALYVVSDCSVLPTRSIDDKTNAGRIAEESA
jgi:hypothetical protein